MTALLVAAIATAVAVASLAALRLIDVWLDRRLGQAWDADDVDPGPPIFEAVVKATRYRPAADASLRATRDSATTGAGEGDG